VYGSKSTEPPSGKGALKSGVTTGQEQLTTAPYKQEKSEGCPKRRSGEENWCGELINDSDNQGENQNEENRSENRKTPGSKDVACQEACVQSFRCRHFEFKSQRLNSREKRRQLVLPSDAAPNKEVPAQADHPGDCHSSSGHFGSMSPVFLGGQAILISVAVTAVTSRSERNRYGQQANRKD